MFTRYLLPRRCTLVLAEVDLAALVTRVEKNAPAIVGHLHVVEMRPPRRVATHRGAQINIEVLRAIRPHVLPPGQVVGLPVLQGSLQCLVFRQSDVVGNLLAVIDGCHVLAPCSVMSCPAGTPRRGSNRIAVSRPCRTPSTHPSRQRRWVD